MFRQLQFKLAELITSEQVFSQQAFYALDALKIIQPLHADLLDPAEVKLLRNTIEHLTCIANQPDIWLEAAEPRYH
jgi:hypothetical protein